MYNPNLKNIDGLAVHSSAGLLDSIRAQRDKPTARQIFTPTETDKSTQYIQWPHPDITDPTLRAFLLAKSYSEFYPVEGREPSQMAMAAAIVSMLNNIVDPNLVSSAGTMSSALKLTGVHPIVVTYDVDEATRLAEDEDVHRFLQMFDGHNRELFCHHRDQQLLMFGIILLTMGKQVTAEGFAGWMDNRVRSLGIPDNYCVWTSTQYPDQRAMSAMNYLFTASFQFRRKVFSICVSCAAGQHRICNIFRDVVLLLQGAEMNHIILIGTYVFNKYPELLRIRLLRDNMATYNAAMEFLFTIPSGERMYVKLLYPKDQRAILNRNNFSLLASAAVSVARFENPSFKFYRGGSEDKVGASIKNVIMNYLSFRVNMAPIAMSYSPFAYMSKEEQDRLRKQMEGKDVDTPTLFTLPVVPPTEAEHVIPTVHVSSNTSGAQLY
jgi:hypothetical protein